MPENDWNSWKMTILGLLLMGATALVTTLVVGHRGAQEEVQPAWATTHTGSSAQKASMPRQIDVEACNAYARQQTEGVASVYGAAHEAAYRSCMRQKGY